MSVIEALMITIAETLPHNSKCGRPTIREISLTLDQRGKWEVMAGGHPAVHIGEWGGDFSGCGETAEAALASCLKAIKVGLSR